MTNYCCCCRGYGLPCMCSTRCAFFGQCVNKRAWNGVGRLTAITTHQSTKGGQS